jgi:hypothetical protein
MAGSTQNLIQGVGYLYHAPLGTTEPADSALGDAPESPFRALGFTKEGVTLTVTQEYEEQEVDQIVDRAGSRLIKREVKIATNLAEGTLENWAAAMNELEEAITSGAGSASFEPSAGPDLQGEPNYALLLFDGFAPNGKARRVIIRRALQVGEVEAAFTKEGQTVYPVEFAGHYVSETVAPYKIVDEVASGG